MTDVLSSAVAGEFNLHHLSDSYPILRNRVPSRRRPMRDIDIGFKHDVVHVKVVGKVDITFVIHRSLAGKGRKHPLGLCPGAGNSFRAPEFRRTVGAREPEFGPILGDKRPAFGFRRV